MMTILTVVGARPQFVKAAAVSQVLRAQHTEFLVHTGQHYDVDMSDVFFQELGIPEPDVNLGVGSGAHGAQTGQMLARLEAHMLAQAPDWVLLYGDTNSTLAGALAAAKLNIPVAHIEAGLRSYNRTMPEEINRVLTDHVSRLLFCPTHAAIENLAREGITAGVHHVGDVMMDVLWRVHARREAATVFAAHEVPRAGFILATIHRPANTDARGHLAGILDAFAQLARPVVLPMHPRLKAALTREALPLPENVQAIPPVSYLNMVALLDAADLVITDSGGLQKEAYALERRCVTVRPETEWVETVAVGWNRLAEPNTASLCDQAADSLAANPVVHPDFYGAGDAGAQIVRILSQHG